MERRLIAILAADVVGYSRMMGVDEVGTLERLRTLRTEIVQPNIRNLNGRVVKLMGDGLLAEFPSVVDAVNCAIEIQKATVFSQAEKSSHEQIQLRIGVNLGDVIVEGSDIYGDGVNVAARLESIAEPGGVCISRAAHDQLGGRVDCDFVDLGQKNLKNIKAPIQVWQWTANPNTDNTLQTTDTHGFSKRPAIAVLPFANMSNDPEQEYFADGLTEDIITALTYWRTFPVIARNSCFAYKDKAVNIKQASRELGARYLLEGSVRKSASQIRITAQLIDGTNGQHIWADRYDRALIDIFQVQDEIVQCISAVITPELARAELSNRDQRQVEDLEAWDLVLRAMPLVRKRTAGGNAEARELFLRAISLSPEYSDAHAGLAMTYSQDILIGASTDLKITANLALEAAQKAVVCDENSSWAHHELSTAYQWSGRVEDALDEARTSVTLNPNDAYALHALGNKSDLAGEADGIALMEKAQRLNPEDASRHSHLTFLARAYFNSGEYDKSVVRARHAIRREPDYLPAHFILALALGQLGNSQEAKAILENCEKENPGFLEQRRNWHPYEDQLCNERIKDALDQIVNYAVR